MEKRFDWLPVKLVTIVLLCNWLIMDMVIYWDVEQGEYWAHLAGRFLLISTLISVLMTKGKRRLLWGGGVMLAVVLTWVISNYTPSIAHETQRMLCDDVNLDYDEAAGACVARK